MDTKWCQMLLRKEWGYCQMVWSSMLLFEGRISFLRSDYTLSKGNGRFASMMVYLGDDQKRFRQQFKKFGVIV